MVSCRSSSSNLNVSLGLWKLPANPLVLCLCVGHMTTYRNDTKTGLETQSKLISYKLFWEVGGVSRVQSTDLDVLVLCVCVWRHDHIQKRHQNRTWNTVEVDIIQFVLRSGRSESCTEYWLWCAGLCVGVDRTTDVWTRRLDRECSLPWHVWIDSRTRVKYVYGVKDDRCIEDSCGHVVRLQTWYTGLSC